MGTTRAGSGWASTSWPPDRFFSPSYTLLSRDGEWLGRIAAPDGLRVLDVAGGRVLGIVDDEMGAESVVVCELVGS